MDWRRLPSLFALRAFEAAARTGGLSRAAAELNVTHAAIAQHVRALEADLGTPLLRREGRGMTATSEGAALAAALGDGFARIAEGWETARAGAAGRPVRVTLTPSFAEIWLMPRLPGFWRAHPGVHVTLEPDTGIVALDAAGPDLAIRYGRGGWDVPSELLVASDFAVVAAPGHLPEGDPRDPATFAGATWLLDGNRREDRTWSRATGIAIEEEDVRVLPTNALVLAAVRAGAGLSVQPEALYAPEVARGTLVAGFRGPATAGLGYHLLRRPGPRAPQVEAFAGWLASAARVVSRA